MLLRALIYLSCILFSCGLYLLRIKPHIYLLRLVSCCDTVVCLDCWNVAGVAGSPGGCVVASSAGVEGGAASFSHINSVRFYARFTLFSFGDCNDRFALCRRALEFVLLSGPKTLSR